MSRRDAFFSVGWFATLLGCKQNDGAGSDAGGSRDAPSSRDPMSSSSSSASAPAPRARPSASLDPTRIRAASESVAAQPEEAIRAESRRLGPLVAEIVRLAGTALVPGATTQSVVDRLVQETLTRDLQPAMLGYNGFPSAAAVSVNDELLHGIPSRRPLAHSDLVKVEFGVVSQAAFASHSHTFSVGPPGALDQRLIDTGLSALDAAIATVSPRSRLGDVGFAIQSVAEAAGLSVVREFVGYGMGKARIQAPQVHATGKKGTGMRMRAGLILNLHVILKRGTPAIRVADNQWTALAADGERGVLFATMVEVTGDGRRVLASAS